MNKKSLGAKGEDLALDHLKKIGYRFIDRNFSCPLGEIDLIVKDKKTVVFVEVKTRKSTRHGSPAEAVTPWKLKSIIKTAHWFQSLNPKLPKRIRIDVIALENKIDGSFDLKHIKNVTG